jgi:hypothetical protein
MAACETLARDQGLATLVIRNAKPEPVATPEHELVA